MGKVGGGEIKKMKPERKAGGRTTLSETVKENSLRNKMNMRQRNNKEGG